jgi:hypothetical protein
MLPVNGGQSGAVIGQPGEQNRCDFIVPAQGGAHFTVDHSHQDDGGQRHHQQNNDGLQQALETFAKL